MAGHHQLAADWFAGIGQWEQALQHWSAANAIRQRTGIDAEQVFPLLQVATALGLRPSEGMGRSSPETAPITVERALDAAIRALESTPVPATVGARRPARSPDDLTPREREVLELVVAGHTNAEIGSALYISRKTASVHVANIKAKLGAGSRVEVATTALQRDLVRRVPKPAAVAR